MTKSLKTNSCILIDLGVSVCYKSFNMATELYEMEKTIQKKKDVYMFDYVGVFRYVCVSDTFMCLVLLKVS